MAIGGWRLAQYKYDNDADVVVLQPEWERLLVELPRLLPKVPCCCAVLCRAAVPCCAPSAVLHVLCCCAVRASMRTATP